MAKQTEIDFNKKYGELIILYEIDRHQEPNGQLVRMVMTKCSCGSEKAIRLSALTKSANTKSCGCLTKKTARDVHTKHGLSRSRVYNSWDTMIQRSTNQKNSVYRNYGGRGIKVCERWLESFDNFYQDMGDRPEGCSLERRNNNEGYKPSNCYWANKIEQANNTRKNRYLEYKGKKMTVAQWARTLGLKRTTLNNRLYRNWPVEKTLNTN